jgi:glyoxylase-like metal-dependent hydrolase (beta-lactamase superfamily II)
MSDRPTTAAISLAPGVWRIPTFRWDLINTFVLRDADGQVTLVDTGYQSAPTRILAGLRQIGSGPSAVTRILLTHAHSDHAGGAAGLAKSTGAGVVIHTDDAEYVRTGRAPATDRSLLLGRLMRHAPRFGASPVEQELRDGQVLDVAGGLRVVHTPGHTPGHVSLLHEPSRLLITGDSIWNMRARMTWPFAAFCTSFAQTRETAAVLGDLDYDLVAFTHGPEIRQGAREAIRAFLHQPRRFRGGL